MKHVLPLLFLFALSCGVKQPVEHITIQKFGDIVVTSTPTGALIHLDGQSTHKITPDTLTRIAPGIHSVHVILDEHRTRPDSIIVDVQAEKIQHADFTLEKLSSIGTVYIESSPSGATIFVDGQNYCKTTPDTVQLEQGTHNIQIIKNGYTAHEWHVDVIRDSTIQHNADLAVKPCVLIETFGNVSCDPCVAAAENLHTFKNNTPAGDYAIIEYYANWPSPNDPFYKEAPKDVMDRVMYYQLTTLPSMFIGGQVGADAANYEDIDEKYKTTFSAQSQTVGVSIDNTLVDGLLTVNIETIFFEADANRENLVLFVAIIENNIYYESAPGKNGLKDFDFVFRGFLTDKKGDPISEGQESQTLSYTLSWPGWNYAHSQIIAFIQNKETKEIIQTSIN